MKVDCFGKEKNLPVKWQNNEFHFTIVKFSTPRGQSAKNGGIKFLIWAGPTSGLNDLGMS